MIFRQNDKIIFPSLLPQLFFFSRRVLEKGKIVVYLEKKHVKYNIKYQLE